MPSSSICVRDSPSLPSRHSSDLGSGRRTWLMSTGSSTTPVMPTSTGLPPASSTSGRSRSGRSGGPSMRSSAASTPRWQRSHRRSTDRKRTRLNSSHLVISYAVVFYLRQRLTLLAFTSLFRSWVSSPHVAYEYWEQYYPGDAYVDWVATGVLNFGPIAQWSKWWTFDEIFGSKYPQMAKISSKVHRSEENTSELQSPCNIVCRRLLSASETHPPCLHVTLPILGLVAARGL